MVLIIGTSAKWRLIRENRLKYLHLFSLMIFQFCQGIPPLRDYLCSMQWTATAWFRPERVVQPCYAGNPRVCSEGLYPNAYSWHGGLLDNAASIDSDFPMNGSGYVLWSRVWNMRKTSVVSGMPVRKPHPFLITGALLLGTEWGMSCEIWIVDFVYFTIPWTSNHFNPLFATASTARNFSKECFHVAFYNKMKYTWIPSLSEQFVARKGKRCIKFFHVEMSSWLLSFVHVYILVYLGSIQGP